MAEEEKVEEQPAAAEEEEAPMEVASGGAETSVDEITTIDCSQKEYVPSERCNTVSSVQVVGQRKEQFLIEYLAHLVLPLQPRRGHYDAVP